MIDKVMRQPLVPVCIKLTQWQRDWLKSDEAKKHFRANGLNSNSFIRAAIDKAIAGLEFDTLCQCNRPGFDVSHPDVCPTCGKPHRD